jgi:pilus assembly protein CpaB
MLLAALAAGLVAAALAARWLQGQGADMGRIAVAHADIPLGARLSPQMVRLAEWPRSSVPAGAFTTLDALDGRVVTVAVLRGEPLTEARLAPVGARAGLSAVVPEGKRAMTVRVNDVVGVAGFALPGTYVDVLVNTQDEGARRGDADRSISKIVLERILVLAVAQEADRDASRPKVVSAVTLEVTPAQAEKLDLARSVGTLSLVLRNQTDPQTAATGGATKSELLGLVAAPSPAPVRRLAPVVPVRAQPAVMPPPPAAPAPVTAPAAPPAAASKTCVEIVAGPVRRTECF